MKTFYLSSKPFLIICLILIPPILLCSAGFGDTVRLNNKSSLKGIVVEDYGDRIIYSTADGEKEILKSEIAAIEYDEPVDNLIGLGDSYYNNGSYKSALKYYIMAQEINPHIRALNDKIVNTETIIYKDLEIRQKEYLDLKNEIISGRAVPKPLSEKVSYRQQLRKVLGLSLVKKGGKFYIAGLKKDSPFRKAGLKKKDSITAVWSRLCSYVTYKELNRLLNNPEHSRISITIERELNLAADMPFGAEVVMEWEGPTINTVSHDGAAAKAGLKKRDVIIAIDKKSTRYMPLEKVIARLQRRPKMKAITIQRKVTVFKAI